MQIEKLTNQLQQGFAEAQSIAIGNDHSVIETVHLLLALLNQQGGSVRPLLSQAEFDIRGLQDALDLELDKLPKIQIPSGDVRVSQTLNRLMNLADRTAQKNKDQFFTQRIGFLRSDSLRKNLILVFLQYFFYRKKYHMTFIKCPILLVKMKIKSLA